MNMPIISNFQRESFKVSDIPDGSESVKGLVQLSSDLNSTSTTLAATPKAMKNAYDTADSIESSIPKSIVRIHGLSNTTFTITNGNKTFSGKVYSNGISDDIEIADFGTYTVTGIYDGISKTTSFTISSIRIYNINVYLHVSFNEDSYEFISKMSKNGTASSYYSIGDVKGVYLSGTVGSLSLYGTYYMAILAFNHNSSVEMSDKPHIVCGFGKSSLSGGVDTCFVDKNFYESVDDSGFKMENTSNSNSGGWKNSYMRTTICSAFQSILPSGLRSILRSRTIYTDNTGGGMDNSSSVTATTDTVYIPSEFEISGQRIWANSYEEDYQKQLAYYKNGNSIIRYKHSDLSSTVDYWWTRSVDSSTEYKFTVITYLNNISGYTTYRSTYSFGFVPLITI